MVWLMFRRVTEGPPSRALTVEMRRGDQALDTELLMGGGVQDDDKVSAWTT